MDSRHEVSGLAPLVDQDDYWLHATRRTLIEAVRGGCPNIQMKNPLALKNMVDEGDEAVAGAAVPVVRDGTVLLRVLAVDIGAAAAAAVLGPADRVDRVSEQEKAVRSTLAWVLVPVDRRSRYS